MVTYHASGLKKRLITTVAPLEGGGYLANDLTLTVDGATTSSRGVITLAGDLAGTADAPTVPALVTQAADIAAETAARIAADALLTPKTRLINTTAPLQGGGDLSSDRTLTVDGATTISRGVVMLAGDLAGTADAPTVPGLATEIAARSAADLLFLLLDGTRPMTGNLDFGTHKGVNLSPGVADTDAVNVGQMNDAIDAGGGGTGGGMEHGTSFPSTFPVDGLFLRDDEGAIYSNTGTEPSPSWTEVLSEAAAEAVAATYTDGAVAAEALIRSNAITNEANARIAGDANEASARSAADALLVPKTRTISTTAPLTGGGDLSTDLTLAISDATGSSKGVIKLAGDLAGSADSPEVAAVHETSGPTQLVLGSIGDGQFLKRVGATVVGAAASGAGSDTTAIHTGDAAGGDLSGTYPNPNVAAIHETSGPTKLTIGAIADGEVTRRSGSTFIGISRAGIDTTAVQKDGSVAMTGNLNLNSHQITSLSDGTLATDAVNLGQLDAAVDAIDYMLHGTSFPLTYEVDRLFLKDDSNAIYYNSGTEGTPVWTRVLSEQDAIDIAEAYTDTLIGTEASTRAAADSTNASAIVSEAATRASADSTLTADGLTYFKKDGSRAMTGNLDFNSHKGINLSNGTSANDAINLGQLDAAISAGLGALGVYTYCRAHASADLSSGVSPRTFQADTNDSITHAALHSTSSNPDRFIANQNGYYLFQARFKVQGYGGCTIQWYKNGTLADETYQPESRPAVGQDITFIHSTLLIPLLNTEYVTCKVFGLAAPDSGAILASSAISMFLLSANGVGGGDFMSDGSVPMTGDLDFGGQKGINLADGTLATDAATVGQVSDLVDTAVDAAIIAEDIPGQIDTAIDAAIAGLDPIYVKEWVTKKDGNHQTTTTPTAIPGVTVTVDIKGSSDFFVKFTGQYTSQGISHPRVKVGIYVDGVSKWESYPLRWQVGAGDDFFNRMLVSFEIPFNLADLSLSEGSHTIQIFHYDELNHHAQVVADAGTFPALIVEYVPAP